MDGEDRRRTTLLPDRIEDYASGKDPVRVIEAFVAALALAEPGFEGVVPERTGRPGHHPATPLKLHVHGYLNRIRSSRRLERAAGRNVELMWPTGRLAADSKTIADFRKRPSPPPGAGRTPRWSAAARTPWPGSTAAWASSRCG